MSDTNIDFHPILSPLAAAWTSKRGRINRDALPDYPVMDTQVMVRDYARNWKIPKTAIAEKAMPRRIEEGTTLRPANLVTHALTADYTRLDVMRSMARGGSMIDVQMRQTIAVRYLLELAREKEVSDWYADDDNYDAGAITTLAGNSQFNDKANSDPVDLIDRLVGNMLIQPTRIIMGWDVFQKLHSHPKVVGAYRAANNANAGERGLLSADQVGSVWGFEPGQCLVGRGWYDNAAEGAAENRVRIWGKDIYLAAVGEVGNVANPEPFFGCNMTYDKYGVTVVEGGTLNLPGAMGVGVVKVCELRLPFQMNKECGVKIKNAVA